MSAVFEFTVQSGGERFACQPQQVLQAMVQEGLRCVPVGCCGGGCGLCKVRVLSGLFGCGRMSCRLAPADAREQSFALACRLFARSDLCIER